MSQLPTQLGPFDPVRRLGAGGMAETFVAVRRGPAGFEQRACIKRILPAYENDKEFVEAFLREARTSAQLRHVNIVQVLDFGVADGSHYLALELIDGLDLRALTTRDDKQRDTFDAELVTMIAGDLAAALEHAHAADQGREPVVHRDVSPSNVLVSRAGEIKLTDFGIARAIGGTHQTATGIIKGKVPYLPPEYVEHGQFDQRSDLFSLGVLLFELCCGKRPFDGETDLDTVRRIVAGEHPPLRSLSPHTPPALAACIERLIKTDPAQRFESARAFLDALPAVAIHQARRRLGERVKARLGETAVEDPAVAHTVQAAPSSQRPPAATVLAGPTRTLERAEPRSTRVSLPALLALALASMVLATMLVLAFVRFGVPQSEAYAHAPVPPLPQPAKPEPPEPAVAPPPVPSATPAPAPSVEEKPRAPAELRVVVIPFGDVWVDGKPLGPAPVTVKLAPGAHEVGAGDGRPSEHRTVHLSSSERDTLVFRREAEGKP